MRKWIVVASWLVGMAVSAQAAFQAAAIAGPRPGSIAGQFSLGMADGLAKEHVYDYENPDGSRRKLSRLDWDIKNVIMGGVNGSYRLLDKLTVNGGIWVALSKGSGEMDDYDWMNVGSTDWTHYSLSEVDVTTGYIFDFNLAWDLLRGSEWTLRGIFGYKQDGWKWEDRGVYLLYPEYNYVPIPLDGENMIDYEQEIRMPYLGASGDWRWNDLTLAGYLTWSPIVEADDWDHHIARTLKFHETFEGGDMFGAGMEVRYDFTRGFFKGAFVNLAVDYQVVDLIIGDMEVEDYSTGERGSEKDVAGLENQYVVFSLGGGIRF